jgi:hypothetical protein
MVAQRMDGMMKRVDYLRRKTIKKGSVMEPLSVTLLI